MERIAMSERPYDHIAAVHFAHPAVNVLELIVGVLVVQNASGDDRARNDFDLLGKGERLTEVQPPRHRRDLVDGDPYGRSSFRIIVPLPSFVKTSVSRVSGVVPLTRCTECTPLSIASFAAESFGSMPFEAIPSFRTSSIFAAGR